MKFHNSTSFHFLLYLDVSTDPNGFEDPGAVKLCPLVLQDLAGVVVDAREGDALPVCAGRHQRGLIGARGRVVVIKYPEYST